MSIITIKKREILEEQLKLNEQKIEKIQKASSSIKIKIDKIYQQDKLEEKGLLNNPKDCQIIQLNN